MRAWNILQRVIAALPGGYGVSVLASIGLARILPMERSEAVMAAVMIGFLLHAGVAIWAFAAADTLRMWVWLALAAAPLAVLTWM